MTCGASSSSTSQRKLPGKLTRVVSICSDLQPAPDSAMWMCRNSENRKCVSATGVPNAFRLYDTLGNVWE